ncbi:MAG: hypothetical protein ACUZ8O_13870 [Candidatus Anammoxibacter sp.]
MFTDESEEGNGITITKRTWDFGNDSKTKVTNTGGADNKNKTVEFNEEGVHMVTLEVTADIADIGLVLVISDGDSINKDFVLVKDVN